MKKFIIILFIVLIYGHQCYSQKSSSVKNINSELIGYRVKNYVQLTLQTGFIHPVSPYLANNNYTSGNLGFDVSYRVNTEVALYTEMKYNYLTARDSAAPRSGYIEATIGARYYIRPACCRSSIFFETGFGPYIFTQGSRTTPEKVYESQFRARMGANAGIGAELVLTNSLFLILKSKMNAVFESNGCTSYVTGLGGLAIRF
jgi:hypothetical protein